MLRRILVSAVAVITLTATAGAGPTGKPVEDDFSDSFVDADFCGTGADVAITTEANQTLWIGGTGGDP